jgi:hypothetical protein
MEPQAFVQGSTHEPGPQPTEAGGSHPAEEAAEMTGIEISSRLEDVFQMLGGFNTSASDSANGSTGGSEDAASSMAPERPELRRLQAVSVKTQALLDGVVPAFGSAGSGLVNESADAGGAAEAGVKQGLVAALRDGISPDAISRTALGAAASSKAVGGERHTAGGLMEKAARGMETAKPLVQSAGGAVVPDEREVAPFQELSNKAHPASDGVVTSSAKPRMPSVGGERHSAGGLMEKAVRVMETAKPLMPSVGGERHPAGGLMERAVRVMETAKPLMPSVGGERHPADGLMERAARVMETAKLLVPSAGGAVVPDGPEVAPLQELSNKAQPPSDGVVKAVEVAEKTLMHDTPNPKDETRGIQRPTNPAFQNEAEGADATPDRSGSAKDSFELPASDQRLSRAYEAGSDRGSLSPVAVREKELAEGAVRTGLFDQIVKRAVVQFRNDQSEIKIDLKPELLGNVRMQVLTENQQVSVRILAELPAVRDMLEAGLAQLKTELQSQGMQVDRLEVHASDDLNRQHQRRAQSERDSRAGTVKGIGENDRNLEEEQPETRYFRLRSSGPASIDMFV